jgi:uncharacterized membrane protein YfcA
MRSTGTPDVRLRPLSPWVKKNRAAAGSTAGVAAVAGTTIDRELIRAFRGRLTMARKPSSTVASSGSLYNVPAAASIDSSTTTIAHHHHDGVKGPPPLSPPPSPTTTNPITLPKTLMASKARGGGRRAASRRLALVLACTYAASVGADVGAEAPLIARAGEAPPSTSTTPPRDHQHESLGASFLRLVEESATRPTQQWRHSYYPATSDEDEARSSGSGSSVESGTDTLFAGALTETGLLAAAAGRGADAATTAPFSPVSSWIATAAAPETPPHHKPLLPPRPSDVVIFLLGALTLFAAAGGGIGGGTLFVPLFTVVGGFAPTNAVALSNITVFGGAIANFLLNVRRPYARALRALPRNALSGVKRPPPLIDMDVILMMEPATLVGALVGGYVHRLLPSWLLLTLLSALLTFLAWQLLQKGASTYAAETREQQRDRAADAWATRSQPDAEAGGLSSPLLDGGDEDDDEAAGGGKTPKKRTSGGAAGPPLIIVAGGLDSSSLALTDDIGRGDQGDPSAASGSAASSSAAAERPLPPANAAPAASAPREQDPLERLLKMPAQIPYAKLAVIALLTIWMLGADTAKMLLPCGSAPYVLASLSIVPLAAAVTFAQRALLLRRAKKAAEAHDALDAAQQQERQERRQQEQAGLLASPSSDGGNSNSNNHRWSPAAIEAALASHVRWTPKNSVLYPLLSTIAGVCASMFGIGGGVVKGPLMLSLGVCPEVAAATSSTMILFTSAGASLFYFNAGFVQRDYALALLVTAFVVTWAGQLASQRLVKALGRRSIIVFVMAGMMMVAAVVAVLQSAFATRAAVREGDLWDWGSVCSRGGL